MIRKKTKATIMVREKLVGHLHLSHLSRIQQDQITDALLENVATKVNLAIWNNFSEAQRGKLKEVVMNMSQKEVFEYVSNQVDNFPKLIREITRETVNDFKKIRAGY